MKTKTGTRKAEVRMQSKKEFEDIGVFLRMRAGNIILQEKDGEKWEPVVSLNVVFKVLEQYTEKSDDKERIRED